ncbi:MAG: tRNA pseudouridine(55) synthase TruB [Chromatiales bacterium]|nr:tRNA pseudouridine(55) synthase TruB [Chromatiales bacterium]
MRTRAPRRAVDGILLLDKPPGCTSNIALQRVKRLFQAAKAGHTGSLDPLATGMLPICLGQATKLSTWLLSADKTYRVALAIGARTDTGDADGTVVESSELVTLPLDLLRQVLPRFLGEQQQLPPMYSALKQGGRRLYELARAGVEVERAPRSVTIHEIAIEDPDPARPVLRIRCSKGTYIRTLVEDVARAAGRLAHVSALRRLAVEPFGESPMFTLEALEALAAARGLSGLDGLLLGPAQALAGWTEIRLGPADAFYLRQGSEVNSPRRDIPPGLVRLSDVSGNFLGIGELLPEGRIQPRRLFNWSAAGHAGRSVTVADSRVQ